MYCAKCRYHAQDHLQVCPKCNTSWEDARKALGLDWMRSDGFPWLSPTPQAEPIVSDLLDVDDILAPPPTPEPEPVAAAEAAVVDIDDLPQFTPADTPPSASTPPAGTVEDRPEAPTLAEPLTVEPLPEIEVDLSLESEPAPRAPQDSLEPLDEVTPEENFLERLSADMPASDHILLEAPEDSEITATPTEKTTPTSVETAAEAELDLVLEIEEEPFSAEELASRDGATSAPQSPAHAPEKHTSEDLLIPELEELLGPPTPPAAAAAAKPTEKTTPPTTSPTASEEDDEFAIILLDDDEDASS
ncbi:MAG: hypothetical protein H5U09_01420 [Desulfomicrobiaceae bacterium]|nr:hypothetical protein [Desulfomicrobiaceae bacterium]